MNAPAIERKMTMDVLVGILSYLAALFFFLVLGFLIGVPIGIFHFLPETNATFLFFVAVSLALIIFGSLSAETWATLSPLRMSGGKRCRGRKSPW
jgi:hypothetical protein